MFEMPRLIIIPFNYEAASGDIGYSNTNGNNNCNCGINVPSRPSCTSWN